MEIEKEIAREVALGVKHLLRKSADCKAQIRKTFVSLTGLICALRSADFLRWCLYPKCNLTHNLFFYFQLFLVLIYTSQSYPDGQGHNIRSTSISLLHICHSRPLIRLLSHVFKMSSSSGHWSLCALLGLVRWENSCSVLARCLSKRRDTALWMILDATQAGASCTVDSFRNDGDWGQETERGRVCAAWLRLDESEGAVSDGENGLGETEWLWSLVGKRTTLLAELPWMTTWKFQLTENTYVRWEIVGRKVGVPLRVKCCQSWERPSKRERCVSIIGIKIEFK